MQAIQPHSLALQNGLFCLALLSGSTAAVGQQPASSAFGPVLHAAGQASAPLQPGLVRPVAYQEDVVAPQPAPAAAPVASPANGVNDRYIQMSFRLRHIPAPDLEYHLLRLGIRPETNGDYPSDRYSSFQWKSGKGAAVGLRIDRKGNLVELEGMESSVRLWRNLITMIDAAPDGRTTQVVPLVKATPENVQKVITLVEAAKRNAGLVGGAAAERPRTPAIPTGMLQAPGQAPPAATADEPPPGDAAGGNAMEDAGLQGPVQVEFLEGADGLIIKGRKQDVERVLRLIEEIERQSVDSQPELDIIPMKHVDNRSLADILLQVYDQVYAARQGRITIIPLIKPNALLLIGRKENIETVRSLIGKLDLPTAPQTQLKVFPLKNISAANAELTVRNFFVQRPGFGTDERLGLGTRVNLIADAHSNSLIVQAAPRDMLEVAELLKSLDTETNASKQEVRIFKLKHTLSDDLAPVLQRAVTGQGGATAAAGGAAGQAAQALQGGAGTATGARRSISLQFLEIAGQQSRIVESGILTDTTIVSDPRSNSIVVTGPSKGMELIAALIRRLDELPDSEAQIKVFTITNGDATTLSTLLGQLFGTATGGQQGGAFGGGAIGLNQQTAGGDGSLVPLRFSVDTRTNSIVASGSPGDLRVVNQILIRLDEGDIRDRVTTVYRLQNAPANDVSVAINQLLQGRRQISQLETQVTSPFEQIEREVIVVPEIVSNSLIVSATPRYFEEIKKIVVDLDRRPPMVVIQVMIGEVQLDNTDELGVELGLQDALLFDRGIGVPGFNFNNQPLGNNTTPQALATRDNVAGQALGNFSVGRTNNALGYGGLVLSASSESVSILIRALQDSRRLQVISRPQVQTLDNQPAFVQVGARVPRITSSQLTTNGTINNTVLENVGILLGVTPRTSPDGLIVMEINAEKSQLGPIADGIPISINTNGDVIRSPQILITTAQTTVSARSGQTVILGGLITTSRSEQTRRVPYLADIPVLGRLFRFDSVIQQRRELLIIMTPFVMRTDEDVEWMNQREGERMSWCLADIANIHGATPFTTGQGPWNTAPSSLMKPTEAGKLETVPPGSAAMPLEALPVRPRSEISPPAADSPSILPLQSPSQQQPLPPAQLPPAQLPPVQQPQELPPPAAQPPLSSSSLQPPGMSALRSRGVPAAPHSLGPVMNAPETAAPGLTPAIVVPAAPPQNLSPNAFYLPQPAPGQFQLPEQFTPPPQQPPATGMRVTTLETAAAKPPRTAGQTTYPVQPASYVR